MPDRFGQKRNASWRTWSYLARDSAGVVHAVLKQVWGTQKKRKQQISESNLQDFGMTTHVGQELQLFLGSYVPLAAERSLGDTRQNFCPLPPKKNNIENLSHALQASPCVPQISRELTAQSPDFSQMGAHFFFTTCD